MTTRHRSVSRPAPTIIDPPPYLLEVIDALNLCAEALSVPCDWESANSGQVLALLHDSHRLLASLHAVVYDHGEASPKHNSLGFTKGEHRQ